MPTTVRCPACGHALASLDGPLLAPPVAPPLPKAGPDAPLLLRVSEAAALLGVSRSTLYQLIARGELRVIRIGRSVRVPREALETITALPT